MYFLGLFSLIVLMAMPVILAVVISVMVSKKFQRPIFKILACIITYSVTFYITFFVANLLLKDGDHSFRGFLAMWLSDGSGNYWIIPLGGVIIASWLAFKKNKI